MASAKASRRFRTLSAKRLQLISLWLLLGASPVVAAKTHALLIGISDYSGTEFESLDGPHNDVALMREVLLRRFEIPAANIRVLLDEQATHTGLGREFAALAARVRPGDMVYIHFSGHGSYTRDLNGDERSGEDQTWVSYGSRRPVAGDDADDIDSYDVLDDEIEDWLAAVLAKTDHVIFVSDSCHSASVTRGEAPKVRAAPPDLRPHPFGKRASSPIAARVLRIGAARDVQSAAEFQHQDGTYYGMFTWYWAQALDGAAPGATWSQLFQRAGALVQQSRRASQQPQIEGDRDLLVFGGEFASRPPTVPVTALRRGGTRASLGAGELAGVTVGSVYQLHGTETEEAQAARLEVSRIWPHEAEGEVTDGTLAVGDLVTEVSHAYDFPPVHTFVVADTAAPADREAMDSLRRLVTDLPAYELTESQAASDIVLRVVRPQRDATGKFVYASDAALPRVDTAAEPEVWVLTPLEELVADNLRIQWSNPERGLRLLRENLAKLARIREFRNLANAGGSDSLISVEAIVMTEVAACRDGEDCRKLGDYGLRQISRVALDSMPSDLPNGTLVTFAITNETPTDYYVYLISAGPDGSIVAHFPGAGDRADEALLPSGDNADLFERQVAIRLASPGEEVIKVLASRQPLNLSLLEQAAYVIERGRSGNPLERLLSNTVHGTRGGPNIVPNNAWGAESISINVIPAKSASQ